MKFQNTKACIFDAFGTLFNLNIPVKEINRLAGGKGTELLSIWRRKQLEYTWLLTAMGSYKPFSEVTRDALRYAMMVVGTNASELYDILMPIYKTPVPFPEVKPMLSSLHANSIKTAILSNGTMEMLKAGVNNAGLSESIDHILSVDAIRIYKPRPEVYQMALDQLNLDKNEVLFFSSNQWDVSGAVQFGLPTVWVNQYNQTPEQLPGKPDHVIKSLSEISAFF